MNRPALATLGGVLAFVVLVPSADAQDELIVDSVWAQEGHRLTIHCTADLSEASVLQLWIVRVENSEARGAAFGQARELAAADGVTVVAIVPSGRDLRQAPTFSDRDIAQHTLCGGPLPRVLERWAGASEESEPDPTLPSQEPRRIRVSIGIPLLIGAGVVDDGGLMAAASFRFRPGLFIHRGGGGGFGLYAEVGTIRGLHVSGGIAASIPLTGTWFLTPSVGIGSWALRDLDHQLTVSGGLFVGARLGRRSVLDGSYGFRVDAHVGLRDTVWALSASVQVDLALIAALFAFAL